MILYTKSLRNCDKQIPHYNEKKLSSNSIQLNIFDSIIWPLLLTPFYNFHNVEYYVQVNTETKLGKTQSSKAQHEPAWRPQTSDLVAWCVARELFATVSPAQPTCWELIPSNFVCGWPHTTSLKQGLAKTRCAKKSTESKWWKWATISNISLFLYFIYLLLTYMLEFWSS